MDADDTLEGEFRRNLGKRLAQARKERGLSLRAVGQRLDISHATIGHWETGLNPIDVSKLFLLARLYGKPVAALLVDQFSAQDVAAIVSMKLHESSVADDPQRKAARAG